MDKAIWQKVYWKDRFDADANARHKMSRESERPRESGAPRDTRDLEQESR